MAKFNYQSGIAFAAQTSGLGTVDPTLKALVDAGGSGGSGEITPADGAILGSSAAGIAEDGIEDEYTRDLREKAPISGSFTRPASDFLKELANLKFTLPWKGNGVTISGTPADAEYEPDPGIDAILQGGGLTGSGWAGGVGWSYVPAPGVPFTVKRWGPGFAWVLMDCFADLVWKLKEGGIVDLEVTVAVGSVESFLTESFPTFDYGLMASVSAPVLEQAGHNWGISAAARGFQDGQLSISPGIEDIGDSNAIDGVTKDQNDHTIIFTGSIFGDSGDIDFERVELVRTTAPTEVQAFNLGSAAGIGVLQKGSTFILKNPELRKLKPVKLGSRWGIDIELVAVDPVANGEFELIMI